MKNQLEEIKATLPPNVGRHAGLRPHAVGRSRDRHRAEKPVRRWAAGDRRAVCLSWQHAGGHDRGAGDSAVDAVCLLRHAAIRHFGQLVEFGGDRFRHDCRQLGRDGRKLRASSGRCRQSASQDDRHRPRGRRRSAQTHDVRRTDHHDRLSADPHAGRDRRQTVSPDGADGHFCPDRLIDTVAHTDAGAGQPGAAAAYGRA